MEEKWIHTKSRLLGLPGSLLQPGINCSASDSASPCDHSSCGAAMFRVFWVTLLVPLVSGIAVPIPLSATDESRCSASYRKSCFFQHRTRPYRILLFFCRLFMAAFSRMDILVVLLLC
ncbi:hypothetical protein C8R44DRAFT_115623 [Mycena epipterygia]|nr:hypothetical protein C8R44DRAFT_115623 [Mycena epipterygia]